MKKLLILFAFAALAACDSKEDNTLPVSATDNFGGSLTVTDNTAPEADPYTASNVKFSLTRTDDLLITLTMNDIRFAATMPMGMTIEIPKLKSVTIGEGIVMTSTVDPIIPYIGSRPYPEFEILNFSCELSGGRLRVSFTCKHESDKMTLDHKAVYSGALLL